MSDANPGSWLTSIDTPQRPVIPPRSLSQVSRLNPDLLGLFAYYHPVRRSRVRYWMASARWSVRIVS